MRLLRINGTDVDIDEKTALGVTLQSYDVKEPGKTFVNISNTFSIPLTSHNSQIFGNVQDVQSISTKAYDELSCDYWQDNEHLLIDSKVRVESIDERINLFAFQKPSIWDTLKGVLWPDFLPVFIEWLKVNKGLYSFASPFTGTFPDFISEFANNTEGLILPMTWGNLFAQPQINLNENVEGTFGTSPNVTAAIYLYTKFLENDGVTVTESLGGHFSVYVRTIFEYIEDAYDVNFLSSGGILPGNIWDDVVAQQMFVDAKDITIGISGTFDNFTIFFNNEWLDPIFLPHKDIQDKADKTLYDFVTSFMQQFNVLKDDLLVNGEPVIRLARFDDLESVADVVDWSGNISGKPKFKPTIEGLAQENVIKYSSIFENGDSLLNSKTLISGNKNLDFTKTLIEIDAFVPAVDISGADVYLDLSTKEAFKTFTFMVADGFTDNDILVIYFNKDGVTNASATLKLPKAAIYSLDGEYNFFGEIVTYPKFYEIEKWLTLSDIRNFQFFRQYFIRELGGSFFVNKISGFNPDKALKPTKIELIRLGSRTPISQPDLDIWVDGVADEFADGEGDFWI